MRRAFIAQHHGTTAGGIAFTLALHQHMDAAVQGDDFLFLPCDDFGEVFDTTSQMSDLFFEAVGDV